MEDQDLSDALCIYREVAELPQDYGHKIIHAAAYEHGLIAALKKIDSRFLSAQIPQVISYFARLTDSHYDPRKV